MTARDSTPTATSPMPALDTTGLRARLRDFNDDYAAALDDGDFDAWAGFFTADCHYRVVSRENFSEQLPLSTLECRGIGSVRDRIAATRVTAVFEPRTLRHLVGGVRVLEQGPQVRAQANFALFECLSDKEPTVFMVGSYLDRFVDGPDGLRLAQRVCVYDNWRVRTSLIFPV